jgi:hypothetical protein
LAEVEGRDESSTNAEEGETEIEAGGECGEELTLRDRQRARETERDREREKAHTRGG